jgi:hypothetical protein
VIKKILHDFRSGSPSRYDLIGASKGILNPPGVAWESITVSNTSYERAGLTKLAAFLVCRYEVFMCRLPASLQASHSAGGFHFNTRMTALWAVCVVWIIVC